MSKDQIRKIHFIYGCVSAALLLLTAALLIISCVGIYQSGDRPFSAEAVSAAWQNISVFGWLCLAAVAGSLVLNLSLPMETVKPKGIRSLGETLKRYTPNYDDLTEDERKAVDQERKLRRTAKIITTAMILLLAVYPVIYYADVSHFGVTDLSGDMIRGILAALIPTAAALIGIYLCSRALENSMSREIDVFKSHPLKPEKSVRFEGVHSKAVAVVRCVLLVVGALLVVMGIANDGVADVLGKAIRICTECIGLG